MNTVSSQHGKVNVSMMKNATSSKYSTPQKLKRALRFCNAFCSTFRETKIVQVPEISLAHLKSAHAYHQTWNSCSSSKFRTEGIYIKDCLFRIYIKSVVSLVSQGKEAFSCFALNGLWKEWPYLQNVPCSSILYKLFKKHLKWFSYWSLYKGHTQSVTSESI